MRFKCSNKDCDYNYVCSRGRPKVKCPKCGAMMEHYTQKDGVSAPVQVPDYVQV